MLAVTGAAHSRAWYTPVFQAGLMLGAPPDRIRFGVFEADLRSGELFRQGRKVKLHPQAFQTLALLLEHPGELVTRDELRQKLWRSDTFVDFDLGLNSAVKKVRDALHDSADAPRWVETLPRRGYRFIAPVEIVPIVKPPGASPSAERMERDSPPAVERPTRQPVAWAKRRWVRGVAAASVLIAMALTDVVWRRHHRPTAGTPVRALAVLPLDNVSADPGQEYFADGMTDALITNLAEIRSLTVIARPSVMGFKGTHKTPREIARELHVDAIVEGTLIQAGERVLVNVQLIDAATERHLWTASYERSVGEVTSLQSDIARAVANQIRATLTPDEQVRLRHTASVDRETYDLYVRGRYFLEKLSNLKSIECFQTAIQRRPDYALAYASMAEAYAVSPLEPRERFPKAKAAAIAALRIDDTVAEAHNALAFVYFLYEWDWTGAQREFERAIELNPNYFMAHQWYGQFQKALGWKNWAAEVKRADELNPLSIWVAGGGWYLQSGEYDKAIALMRKKLELDPNNSYANWQMGRVYAAKGMYDVAIQYFEKSVALSDGSPQPISLLGYAYGKSGRRVDAMKMVGQLEQLREQKYVAPHFFATVYVGLGDKDLAFKWLNEAVAKHDPFVVMLNVEFELDSLRADPRFAELTHRVGLPEVQPAQAGPAIK